MVESQDPIQQVAGEDDERDLYGVTTWEERTWLDRFSTSLYGALKTSARWVIVLVAVAILAAQFLLTGLAAIRNPLLGLYVLLSVIPALFIAAYVWKVDVTMQEPLPMLIITFVLGLLFAGFAAVINSVMQDFFRLIPLVGLVLYFFLVVGPIEETVKWAAIRLYAYRSDTFDAVIDGAVYGAVAGLGFATIENTIYIARPYLQATASGGGNPLQIALQSTFVRGFAGPGHVIYSAFAGYYLGLAKFNPENRGPIVVKGLLIAVIIHGTYNSVVSNLEAITGFVPGLAALGGGVVFIGFVIVYDSIFIYVLYRKLSRYRATFRDLDAHTAYEGEISVDDGGDDHSSIVEHVKDREDRE